MGFKLNYRKVPQDTLYTKFCGVPKSNYVICPNVGWFKDFTDPQSLLEPTFKGDAIKPQGNVNWTHAGRQGDQRRDDEGARSSRPARAQPGLGRHQQDDRRAGASAIPYVWDDNINLWSQGRGRRDERATSPARTSRSRR